MAVVPLDVLSRPFAVEPVTSIMLPDGIFDNALHALRIACHYTNTSAADLTNVTLYLESVGDPGVSFHARSFSFPLVPAGGTVLVMWDADFQHATPGKRLVSFVAHADGFSTHRSVQQIFVSQTRYDSATSSYTCTVEEGTLTLSNLSAIVPRPTWGDHDKHGKDCACPPPWGPHVLTGLTAVWVANPAYAGEHGELPFSDPWWKILATIVAIVAAIVAIVAAATGGGTASFGASGTFEETDPSVSCCTPDTGAGPKRDYTVAGVASAIATVAAAVALSDEADPWWRGQAATPPAPGELTIGEKVVAKWSLPDAPNAGDAYTAAVHWTYTRLTTGATYEHSVEEVQINVHVAGAVTLETADPVTAFDPLWVRATIAKADGELFRGSELYAFALFRSPGDLYFVVPLTDDGLDFDPAPEDGVYAGSLDLERAYRQLLQFDLDVRGLWRVYVFAQDVNRTRPGTPPEIAAQHIGGFFVASAVRITFDPTLPCPVRADTTISVV